MIERPSAQSKETYKVMRKTTREQEQLRPSLGRGRGEKVRCLGERVDVMEGRGWVIRRREVVEIEVTTTRGRKSERGRSYEDE